MNRNKPSRQMPHFCRDQRTHTHNIFLFFQKIRLPFPVYTLPECASFSVIIITRFFRENKAFAKTILFESFLPVKASLFGYFPKILSFLHLFAILQMLPLLFPVLHGIMQVKQGRAPQNLHLSPRIFCRPHEESAQIIDQSTFQFHFKGRLRYEHYF